MIELEITPRESSNLMIRAMWFIERLVGDVKELRGNVEILKEQRRAVVRERNLLREMVGAGNKEDNKEEGSMGNGVIRGLGQ